jgi:hypothetical protein
MSVVYDFMFYIWVLTGGIKKSMPGLSMMWIPCKRCCLREWMLLLQATLLCFNV